MLSNSQKNSSFVVLTISELYITQGHMITAQISDYILKFTSTKQNSVNGATQFSKQKNKYKLD